jgi:hypothetical protein
MLFVGPADLQHDLGHRFGAAARDHEECFHRVVRAARSANKQAGLLIRDATELPRRLQQGVTYLAVQSDLALLRESIRALIEMARPAIS